MKLAAASFALASATLRGTVPHAPETKLIDVDESVAFIENQVSFAEVDDAAEAKARMITKMWLKYENDAKTIVRDADKYFKATGANGKFHFPGYTAGFEAMMNSIADPTGAWKAWERQCTYDGCGDRVAQGFSLQLTRIAKVVGEIDSYMANGCESSPAKREHVVKAYKGYKSELKRIRASAAEYFEATGKETFYLPGYEDGFVAVFQEASDFGKAWHAWDRGCSYPTCANSVAKGFASRIFVLRDWFRVMRRALKRCPAQPSAESDRAEGEPAPEPSAALLEYKKQVVPLIKAASEDTKALADVEQTLEKYFTAGGKETFYHPGYAQGFIAFITRYMDVDSAFKLWSSKCHYETCANEVVGGFARTASRVSHAIHNAEIDILNLSGFPEKKGDQKTSGKGE